MATKNATTIQSSPSPEVVELVLGWFEEREFQLLALAHTLERNLGEACNDGKEPPDYAPLTEWRLSQVLVGLAEDSTTMNGARELLCGSEKKESVEVQHG